MLETAYDDAGALHRLRVHVPDRPGVLAGIFQALGAERINVSDFELEHLSPERGGTLTVLVTGEADAAEAASLLERQGYGVVVAPGDRRVGRFSAAGAARGVAAATRRTASAAFGSRPASSAASFATSARRMSAPPA